MSDDEKNANDQNFVPWPDHSDYRSKFAESLMTRSIAGEDGRPIASLSKITGRSEVFVEINDTKSAVTSISEHAVKIRDKAAIDPEAHVTQYFHNLTVVQGSTPEREDAKFLIAGYGATRQHSIHIVTPDITQKPHIELVPQKSNASHKTDSKFKPSLDFNSQNLKVTDGSVQPVDYSVKKGQTLTLILPLPDKVVTPKREGGYDGKLSDSDFDREKPLSTTTEIYKENENIPIMLGVEYHPPQRDFRGTIMPANVVSLPNGTEIHMQEGAKLDLSFTDHDGKVLSRLNYESKEGMIFPNPKAGKDNLFEPLNVEAVPERDLTEFARARKEVQGSLIKREKERAEKRQQVAEQYTVLKADLAKGKIPDGNPDQTLEGVRLNVAGNTLYITQPNQGAVPITIRGDDLFVGEQANDDIRLATAMIDEEENRAHSQPLEKALGLLKAHQPAMTLKDIDFVVVNGSSASSIVSVAGDGNTYTRTVPRRIIHNTGRVQMELMGNDPMLTGSRYDGEPLTLERIGSNQVFISVPKRVEWEMMHGGALLGVALLFDKDKFSGLQLGDDQSPKILLNDGQKLSIDVLPFLQHRVAKNPLDALGRLYDVDHPRRNYELRGGVEHQATKDYLFLQQREQEEKAPEKWNLIPGANAAPPQLAPAEPGKMAQLPAGLEGVPDAVLAQALSAVKPHPPENIPLVSGANDIIKGLAV